MANDIKQEKLSYILWEEELGLLAELWIPPSALENYSGQGRKQIEDFIREKLQELFDEFYGYNGKDCVSVFELRKKWGLK